MLVAGSRLCRLYNSVFFVKRSQLPSAKCLNSSRFLFSRVSCPSSRSITHGRKLHDKNTETAPAEQHQTQKGKDEDSGQGKEMKISQRQKLKKVFAEYGSIAAVFHISMSLTSLGIVYTAVKSGFDVPGALQKIGFSKNITESSVASGASTFVVAYACYKVFAPLRMFITITCTPLIVKKLRRMGILKMPPAKQ